MDVLRLSDFIRNIVDSGWLLRLVMIRLGILSFFCSFFLSVFFYRFCYRRCLAIHKFGKRAVFSVQILINDAVFNAAVKIFILYAAQFNKDRDVIPASFKFFPVSFIESGQFIGNFLRDMFRNFLNLPIVLQEAARNV